MRRRWCACSRDVAPRPSSRARFLSTIFVKSATRVGRRARSELPARTHRVTALPLRTVEVPTYLCQVPCVWVLVFSSSRASAPPVDRGRRRRRRRRRGGRREGMVEGTGGLEGEALGEGGLRRAAASIRHVDAAGRRRTERGEGLEVKVEAQAKSWGVGGHQTAMLRVWISSSAPTACKKLG